MKIVMTAHLKMRMAQRGIAEWQVNKAIREPSVLPTRTPQDSLCYRLVLPQGRVLKVWVVDPPVNDEVVVKSAAWNGEDDPDE